MKRLALACTLITAVILTGLSGCSSNDAESLPAPAPSSAATSTPTPSPSETSATPSESVSEAPCDATGRSTLNILADTWSSAVAAQGTEDAEKYQDEFYDAAKDLSDDVKDDCEDNLALNAAAADLTYEASSLKPNANVDQYKAVTKAGNKLLKTAAVEGTEKTHFIGPECVDQVDITPACTAFKE